jgi:hypothetical protein
MPNVEDELPLLQRPPLAKSDSELRRLPWPSLR